VRRAPWLAVVSLARWSAFGALGARKSWRAKFLPVTLTLIAFLPAFAVLAIRAIVGQSFADRFPELIPYRQYLTEIGLDVTIFAAILCPELLCPDRRDNVLSLYLSTAVGRLTYVVGKLAAALVPLLGLTLLPVLLLFVGNTFFADSATSYLADHWHDVLRIIASGLLLASYVSLLGLAVASFTSRRAFALGGYAALMLIPTYVGGALVFGAGLDRHWQLIMLGRLPIAAARSLYPGNNPDNALSGWWWWAACGVVMAVSAACLWWRYRRADA
jgi:ABC-2 type transport system permease protein